MVSFKSDGNVKLIFEDALPFIQTCKSLQTSNLLTSNLINRNKRASTKCILEKPYLKVRIDVQMCKDIEKINKCKKIIDQREIQSD